MFIVKDIEEDGTIITFDTGNASHWTTNGTAEGTTSAYFTYRDAYENVECTIITIEEVTWDDVEFAKNYNKLNK